MLCPKCGVDNDKVIDSRTSKSGYSIRRRRECLNCEYRFTTIEQIEGMVPMVVKKNGIKEPFDGSKLMKSLNIACSKRPVDKSVREDIVRQVEDKVNKNYRMEITSSDIGNYVMERLRLIDSVAYVRFASVYKDFTDPASFTAEVNNLADNGNNTDSPEGGDE